MERDLHKGERVMTKQISTHTLTWSVTDSTADEHADREISTHTLTWSVT